MNACANISFWRVPRERSLQSTSFMSLKSRKSNHHAVRSSISGILRIAPTKCRYSVAERKLGGVSCSGMIPTRSRTPMGSFWTSRPSTVADPAVGRICPVIILIMVDLPEPLGPNRPKSAPFSTEKVTWLTAVRSPYTFVRPAVPITGAVMAGLPGEWRGNLRTMRKSGDGVPGDTGRYAGECSWGVHRHKGRCRVTGHTRNVPEGRSVTVFMVACSSCSFPFFLQLCRAPLHQDPSQDRSRGTLRPAG